MSKKIGYFQKNKRSKNKLLTAKVFLQVFDNRYLLFKQKSLKLKMYHNLITTLQITS